MKLIPTASKVQIKWFVYAGRQKFPHKNTMRGDWGYDAECSCGWSSKTGGAIYSYVEAEVKSHKIYKHNYKREA
jgi:hypothetical protein